MKILFKTFNLSELHEPHGALESPKLIFNDAINLERSENLMISLSFARRVVKRFNENLPNFVSI